jgi:hypothetical protein
MQTICRCYLSEQLSILGWLFVTTLNCNLSLPYRVDVFQQDLISAKGDQVGARKENFFAHMVPARLAGSKLLVKVWTAFDGVHVDGPCAVRLKHLDTCCRTCWRSNDHCVSLIYSVPNSFRMCSCWTRLGRRWVLELRRSRQRRPAWKMPLLAAFYGLYSQEGLLHVHACAKWPCSGQLALPKKSGTCSTASLCSAIRVSGASQLSDGRGLLSANLLMHASTGTTSQ